MTKEKNVLSELEKLRKKIDNIDLQLLELLNQRATIALTVAKAKQKETGGKKPFFYRPEREAWILKRLGNANHGPLSTEVVQYFFQEIMSACRSLQQPPVIAYLGPEGTYTQQAALSRFGHSAHFLSCLSIDDIFHAVASAQANCGVVPVENSTGSFIEQTLNNFCFSSQRICGEIILRINHNLLTLPGINKTKIKKIYAHQQAFAQCHHWLNRHYPQAERIVLKSNSEGVSLLCDTKATDAAAIAGKMAAEFYQLEVAFTKIEDQLDNTTRFLVLSDQSVAPSEDDKTSVIIILSDERDSLKHILSCFDYCSINLIQQKNITIQYKPQHRAVFIDFEGHLKDKKVQTVLAEIKKYAIETNLLGSYPKAIVS